MSYSHANVRFIPAVAPHQSGGSNTGSRSPANAFAKVNSSIAFTFHSFVSFHDGSMFSCATSLVFRKIEDSILFLVAEASCTLIFQCVEFISPCDRKTK